MPTEHPEAFYKYTTCETAQAVLRSSSLRWSAPVRFNDAFDVPRQLRFGYRTDDLLDAMRSEVADMISADAPDPPGAPDFVKNVLQTARAQIASGKVTREQVVHVARHADIERPALVLPELFQKYWDEQLPRLRILCMTTSPESPQMWAYYGEESRGVALEFGELERFASPFRNLRKVTYTDAPPQLASKEAFARYMLGIERIEVGDYFKDYYFAKASRWQHEAEWRIVGLSEEGDPNSYSDLAFHPQTLRRLIFGFNTHDTERRAIVDILREPRWQHVSLANTSIDHENRRFVFTPMARDSS